MSKKTAYDSGFGTVWKDVFVIYRKGYSTSVTDYHEHEFYELNLILSGNVKILLSDRCEEGTENRLVLTPPRAPHYISCQSDTLYNRLYLMFTEDFIADHIAEWQQLSAVFGETGQILTLTEYQTSFFRNLIEQIKQETSSFRRRMLICYLLSHISELAGECGSDVTHIPSYILEAIAYLENHHHENIIASDLAKMLHIGRTTLMTGFKKHTGSTVGEYLTHCRLRHAVLLLREGKTVEYTASRCGFADSSGLSHSFKRIYGVTPGEYVKREK